MKCINLFLETKNFISTMAPFVGRHVGPSWFTNLFPGVSLAAVAISNAVLGAFLTLTLLFIHVDLKANNFGITSYQPNLVAWEFSLSQILPKSLYSWPIDICWLGENSYHKHTQIALSFTIISALNFLSSSSIILSLPPQNSMTGGRNIMKVHFQYQNF